MAKRDVGDLSKADLEGKVVFVRADLNVPQVRAGRRGRQVVGRVLAVFPLPRAGLPVCRQQPLGSLDHAQKEDTC